MNNSVNIKFMAFIPKSIGKPIRSYFPKTSHLKDEKVFIQKLVSTPHNWLPEPGPNFNYFSTDNREFGGNGTHRILSEANIDLDFTGKHDVSKKNFFNHKCDDSHQIEARILEYAPSVSASSAFATAELPCGYLSTIKKMQGSTSQSVDRVENTLSGTYITTPGSIVRDTTVIMTSASAGYPFAEPVSPNIDYELRISMHDMGLW